ncbi:MAG: FkbM family methyltransferase [Planctomycetota bacterium]
MLARLQKRLRRKADPIVLLEQLRPRHWRPQSLIHVGAHLAQEREHYESLGYRQIWWIEGSETTHAELCRVIDAHNGPATHWVEHALLTDQEDQHIELHQFSNGGASNSIFHATPNLSGRWSHVHETGQSERLTSRTLDTLVKERGSVPWDVLLVDVQGAELLVLNGATTLLQNVKAVICEASTVPYYDSGVLFDELAAFLSQFGFEPVMAPRRHGDILFMRTNDLQTSKHGLSAKQRMRCLGSSLRGLVCHLSAIRKSTHPTKTCQVPKLNQLIQQHLCETAGQRSATTQLDKPPQFVEVGAYDGERFSNTSWLADAGWRGVYVEASPYFASRCQSRHRFNDVSVINVAAGSETKHADMVQNGSLTTLCQATLKQYEAMKMTSSQSNDPSTTPANRVPVKKLDELLDANRVQPGFDLLVVDVEGYEEQVFLGFDLRRWRPRMMIVELCDVHPKFESIPEMAQPASRVRQRIMEAGYRVVYQDQINTVFVDDTAAVVSQPISTRAA